MKQAIIVIILCGTLLMIALETGKERFTIPESIYKTSVYLGQPISEIENDTTFYRGESCECCFSHDPWCDENNISFGLSCGGSVEKVTRMYIDLCDVKNMDQVTFLEKNHELVSHCILAFGDNFKICDEYRPHLEPQYKRPVLFWQKGDVDIYLRYIPEAHYPILEAEAPGLLRTQLGFIYNDPDDKFFNLRIMPISKKWTKESLGFD